MLACSEQPWYGGGVHYKGKLRYPQASGLRQQHKVSSWVHGTVLGTDQSEVQDNSGSCIREGWGLGGETYQLSAWYLPSVYYSPSVHQFISSSPLAYEGGRFSFTDGESEFYGTPWSAVFGPSATCLLSFYSSYSATSLFFALCLIYGRNLFNT